MALRDRDIRAAVHEQLIAPILLDPDAFAVNELGICQGAARVDIAVVNGHLMGYEIKSDLDTFARLPRQTRFYGEVFDRMTLVLGAEHASLDESVVPGWWGIVTATEADGQVVFKELRSGMDNPARDAYAVAQLLWRDEALNLLEERGLARGLRTKPRKMIWKKLAQSLEIEDLAREVRLRIKHRGDWRAAAPPSPDGD